MALEDQFAVNVGLCKVVKLNSNHPLFFPLIDVNAFLNSIRPADALCICGFSWFDFYPSEEMNHILGQGNLQQRTVAFSFGHYGLYKEKEQIQREYWKDDYVAEPSVEIADNLLSDAQAARSDSSYIYVTHKEQMEAAHQLPEIEQECHSVGSSCDGSPTLKRLSTKVKMIIDRKSYKKTSTSFLPKSNSETQSINSNTQLSISSDEDLEGYDTVPDREQLTLTPESVISGQVVGDSQYFLKTAIPIECQFVLNCKIVRRLLRVSLHVEFIFL